jgi:hypothetical protein
LDRPAGIDQAKLEGESAGNGSDAAADFFEASNRRRIVPDAIPEDERENRTAFVAGEENGGALVAKIAYRLQGAPERRSIFQCCRVRVVDFVFGANGEFGKNAIRLVLRSPDEGDENSKQKESGAGCQGGRGRTPRRGLHISMLALSEPERQLIPG